MTSMRKRYNYLTGKIPNGEGSGHTQLFNTNSKVIFDVESHCRHNMGRRYGVRDLLTLALHDDNVNLRGLRIQNTDLSGLDMNEADLTGAMFERCRLDNTLCRKAIMTGCRFSDCAMIGSYGPFIDFMHAHFEYTSIIDSYLHNSIFDHADFDESYICDTDFTNCSFDNVTTTDTTSIKQSNIHAVNHPIIRDNKIIIDNNKKE